MIRRTKTNKSRNIIKDAINASASPQYTIIPLDILRSTEISLKAKSVIFLLLSNKDGWVSYQKTMLKMIKEKKGVLQSALKELEIHGYLMRLKYRDKKTKLWKGLLWAYTNTPYDFNMQKQLQLLDRLGYEVPQIKQDGKPDAGKPDAGKPDAGKSAPKTINNKTINNKYRKNTKKENLDLDKFEQWWNIYPKKVNKQGAMKSWIKLFNLPKKQQPSFETLLLAVKQQSKSKQWQNKQYIPYPVTWLNNRRWEDEIETNEYSNESNEPSNNTNEPLSEEDYYEKEYYNKQNRKPKFNPNNPNNSPDLPGFVLSEEEEEDLLRSSDPNKGLFYENPFD